MTDKQKTLKAPITISGVGLHTGETVNVTIKPAPENHGYRFVRKDMEGTPIILADADNVKFTERGTVLEQNGGRVHTTEHILAALYGCEIDNAIIEMDGPEVPILDGSAKIFVEAIEAVDVQEQTANKNYFVLKNNLTFEDNERNVEMLAVPSDEFRVTVMVDYNSPLLGTQHAQIHKIKEFRTDIAKCRTFVFLREIEYLYNKGLIKGGDAANAIVMVDREISKVELDRLAKLVNKPTVEKQGIGILNNLKLHYENEPARHKLLDIVGDLALVGQPIKGHILAARPGHMTNVEFAKIIKEEIKKEKKNTPVFDLNKEALYDINQISKLLPHRYPFLLLDKVIEMGANYVIGVKNVTMNEEFFTGHFPGNPVMPGVLIVEAMAQTGGILVLANVDDPESYETYFMKIDGVKFKQKVLPGDTLVFKLELLSPIRRGVCHMKGTAYVRGKVVCEGELMAQIVKTQKKVENEPAVSLRTS